MRGPLSIFDKKSRLDAISAAFSIFSFIDVHNEKLFYQNVVILQRIVQMIENIQLNGDQQTQFLGDLFEGFLDRGMKQSEGQFFTPMQVSHASIYRKKSLRTLRFHYLHLKFKKK